jgi:hypothetical protein
VTEIFKWKVFKEKTEDKPLWVVWDHQMEEHLFQTGKDALNFVHLGISLLCKAGHGSK